MARRINDHMPNHVIEITLKALEETGKTFKQRRSQYLEQLTKRM